MPRGRKKAAAKSPPKKKAAPKKKAKATSWLAGIAAVSAKLVTITKAQAQKILTAMRYERQRPTRSVTIGHLVMMLRQEMFIPATLLAFAVGKGIKKTLINGYHRMEALVRKGGSMKFVEVVYRCANAQAMHNLYTCFDTGIGKRTPGNMYAAHAGPEVVESIGRQTVGRLVSAVRFIADMFSQSVAKVQTHNTLLYCVVADHFVKPMGELLKLMATGDMKKLKPQSILQQPVLAVVLTTLKYYPTKAREFWHYVLHNGVLYNNDPCFVLRKLFEDLQERTNRKANGQRNKPTPRVMAYITAHCWNEYCAGRKMLAIDIESLISPANKPPAVTIARTPFSGNVTAARFKQALVDLGLREEHLDHVKEAVKLSATHYSTKKPKSRKRKAKIVEEDSVEVDVSVRHRRRKTA